MRRKLDFDKNMDELLACYAEGLLTDKEKKMVERFLKDHPALQEEVRIQQVVARNMASEECSFIPESVVRKAKSLVSEPFGAHVWILLVRHTREVFRTIKSDGLFVEPSMSLGGALRGGQKNRSKAILVKKEFGAVSIQVEIERDPNTANRIVIFAQDLQTKNPLNDLRITLIENDKELESHVTTQGRTNFESVNDGRYTFDITSPHRPVARITLEISPE